MDGSYGSFKETGWTGLVGMVTRKEADFTLNDLTLAYDRSMVKQMIHF